MLQQYEERSDGIISDRLLACGRVTCPGERYARARRQAAACAFGCTTGARSLDDGGQLGTARWICRSSAGPRVAVDVERLAGERLRPRSGRAPRTPPPIVTSSAAAEAAARVDSATCRRRRRARRRTARAARAARAQRDGHRRDVLGELGAVGAARQMRVEQRALELRELVVDAQRDPRARALADGGLLVVRLHRLFRRYSSPLVRQRNPIKTIGDGRSTSAPSRISAKPIDDEDRRVVERVARARSGVAQRTKRCPNMGTAPVALEPRRPAVAEEEADDEQEAADQVEAERDRAVRAPAPNSRPSEQRARARSRPRSAPSQHANRRERRAQLSETLASTAAPATVRRSSSSVSGQRSSG